MDQILTPAAFIAATGCRRFQWGEVDCCLWPADLIRLRCGFDPAAGLRGTYDSAFTARRAVMKAGGLLALWRGRLRDLPPGSVDGIAVARVNGLAVGGVLSGGRLFVKTENGVLTPEKSDILQGWAV